MAHKSATARFFFSNLLGFSMALWRVWELAALLAASNCSQIAVLQQKQKVGQYLATQLRRGFRMLWQIHPSSCPIHALNLLIGSELLNWALNLLFFFAEIKQPTGIHYTHLYVIRSLFLSIPPVCHQAALKARFVMEQITVRTSISITFDVSLSALIRILSFF